MSFMCNDTTTESLDTSAELPKVTIDDFIVDERSADADNASVEDFDIKESDSLMSDSEATVVDFDAISPLKKLVEYSDSSQDEAFEEVQKKCTFCGVFVPINDYEYHLQTMHNPEIDLPYQVEVRCFNCLLMVNKDQLGAHLVGCVGATVVEPEKLFCEKCVCLMDVPHVCAEYECNECLGKYCLADYDGHVHSHPTQKCPRCFKMVTNFRYKHGCLNDKIPTPYRPDFVNKRMYLCFFCIESYEKYNFYDVVNKGIHNKRHYHDFAHEEVLALGLQNDYRMYELNVVNKRINTFRIDDRVSCGIYDTDVNEYKKEICIDPVVINGGTAAIMEYFVELAKYTYGLRRDETGGA